jgi:hypothetical protein
MKIATTPMCQEILRLAGVQEYQVIKDNIYDEADLLVVLSETEIDEKLPIKFIKLKINTFPQIQRSIELISDIIGTEPLKNEVNLDINSYKKNYAIKKKVKIKVYSNFLKEIAEDMGFQVTTEEEYDFLIYPDYLKDELKKEIDYAAERAVELPSHGKAPLNPIKRAQIRYQILENSICTKH